MKNLSLLLYKVHVKNGNKVDSFLFIRILNEINNELDPKSVGMYKYVFKTNNEDQGHHEQLDK